MKHRKLRMGMIGGGQGAFIGAVHRMAAALDGNIELVCGAFSSRAEVSKASGAELFLPPERCYANFEEMIKAERALPEDVRMDFVSIVTPNHVHFKPAVLALENGFHVVCEKPMTFDVAEARQLEEVVKRTEKLFCLTHNYTGYPMVKQARELVSTGELGVIRKVVVEYPQGWLTDRIESDGQKQAEWRTDPARTGAGGCVGDIGTHAENLAEYITGLHIRELAADITSFVKGRKVDDDVNVLLRFDNGAKGVLHSSQISVGEENNLNIRVYGEKGSLEWHQNAPNTLLVKSNDKPV
ncbi:MAG: Gfo/Idh/MocA family oxidoreductase, partial [Chthoniobacterales bacterium]